MESLKNLLALAYHAALLSPDPSTQNGALIVHRRALANTPPPKSGYRIMATDCNRFPHGVTETPERWNTRELKYKYVQHAERNVIETFRHTHNLVSLREFIMVCPWAACTDCAKAIIPTGISHLVIHKQAHDRTPPGSLWFDDIMHAHTMLREVGIEIIEYDGKVDGPPVRHSGVVWTP
jgi:dCMP deaminase